jgi:hypothetical protein
MKIGLAVVGYVRALMNFSRHFPYLVTDLGGVRCRDPPRKTGDRVFF